MDGESRSILVQAWIETRMERDRALLTLSTGGIGLAAGVIATLDSASSLVVVLFGAGIGSFLIAILCLLQIFKRNSEYIQRLLAESNEKRDARLTMLDRVVSASFIVGVVATSSAAVLHQIT